MNAAELSIIGGLDPRFREQVKAFVAYGEQLLAGYFYRLSVTSYAIPEVAGRRTTAQQRAMFDTGRSKRDGVAKRSRHQDGLAIHFGFRDRRRPALYWAPNKMGASMLGVFMAMVEQADRLGWVWGGRWEPLDRNGIGWDPEHFEAPAIMKPAGSVTAPDELCKDPA